MVLVTAANKNTVIKNTKVNTHGFPKTHLRVIKYIAIKWLTPDCSTMPATITIKKINNKVVLPQPEDSTAPIFMPPTNTNAIQPIILGQISPIVIQPNNSPKKIPTICIPNGVMGSTGGR